ncbi:MAG: hypothetical protein KC897_00825 [Candidatus Omnitrophica bacterium]|nr:hypothetical protein [Candidatus Omnitrophota bacterium]MCB9720254.1 hypothetical protein [Candidatus Omnitrophota bacterium]
MKPSLRITAGLLAACLWAATPARADQTGDPGYIASLELISSISDQYPLYHGEVILQTESGDVAYRWGGSSCPGVALNLEQNRHLVGALSSYAETAHIYITPHYRFGQGGNLCLVGFIATSNAAVCCKPKGKVNDSLIDARLKGKNILQN